MELRGDRGVRVLASSARCAHHIAPPGKVQGLIAALCYSGSLKQSFHKLGI